MRANHHCLPTLLFSTGCPTPPPFPLNTSLALSLPPSLLAPTLDPIPNGVTPVLGIPPSPPLPPHPSPCLLPTHANSCTNSRHSPPPAHPPKPTLPMHPIPIPTHPTPHAPCIVFDPPPIPPLSPISVPLLQQRMGEGSDTRCLFLGTAHFGNLPPTKPSCGVPAVSLGRRRKDTKNYTIKEKEASG